jgi:hypothetical protein
MTQTMLVLHIVGGGVAVLAGYAALFARKGAWLHRRAGVVFVGAMLLMGAGAAFVGLARDLITWTGGITTAYFVITALTTVTRKNEPARWWDVGLMLVALFFGLRALVGGFHVLSLPGMQLQGIPAPAMFMSAMTLLLGATGDARFILRGPLQGAQRIRRHLWRMCYALFSATGSFFLVESRVPEFMRYTPLRVFLAFLPVLMLFYWLWRVRRRNTVLLTRLEPVAAQT